MILEKWDDEAKEVVRKFSSNEKDRLDAIIAMHIMVCNMNDESAYMAWIELAVPDCPSEWDFIDLHRMMKEQRKMNRLMKQLICSRNYGMNMQKMTMVYT